MSTTLAIALSLLGLALLILGIRGRRTGTAPHCRACNFDVTGVTTTCPECGRDLTKPRAAARGVRRRRPQVATTGAQQQTAGIAAAVVAASGIDLNPHKPTWWLARFDSRRLPGPELDAAMTELTTRINSGTAAESSVRPAIAIVLDRQADRTSQWSPVLGDVFEAAWAAGFVDEQERLRYLRQALNINLWVLDPDAAGTIRVGIDYVRDRVATTMDPGIAAPVQFLLLGGEIANDQGVVARADRDEWGQIESGIGTLRRKSSMGVFAGSLSAGEYTLRTRWRVRVDPGIDSSEYGGGSWSSVYNADRPPARDTDASFLEWEETLVGRATVLAEDVPAFDLVTDPEMLARIRAAIGLQQLKLQRSGNNMIWIGGTLEINFDDLPVALDHYLVVRQGEREWKLNKSQRIAGGKRPWTYIANPQYPGIHIGVSEIDPTKPFDLLLRPDPRVAMWAHSFRQTGSPVPIYGGEIPLVEGATAE